jgi:hypothetical protein
VQPQPEVEEDPEEVQQEEDPVEQPQLYDGTVPEADAMVILLCHQHLKQQKMHHLHQLPLHPMLSVEIRMT